MHPRNSPSAKGLFVFVLWSAAAFQWTIIFLFLWSCVEIGPQSGRLWEMYWALTSTWFYFTVYKWMALVIVPQSVTHTCSSWGAVFQLVNFGVHMWINPRSAPTHPKAGAFVSSCVRISPDSSASFGCSSADSTDTCTDTCVCHLCLNLELTFTVLVWPGGALMHYCFSYLAPLRKSEKQNFDLCKPIAEFSVLPLNSMNHPLGRWWIRWWGTSRCRYLGIGSLGTMGRGTCTQHTPYPLAGTE